MEGIVPKDFSFCFFLGHDGFYCTTMVIIRCPSGEVVFELFYLVAI